MGKIGGKLSPRSGIVGGLTGRGSISGSVSPAGRDNREKYTGEYVVTPHTKNEQVLDTAEKVMTDDVHVLKVPYFETSNQSNGYTVYIGEV